MTSTSMRRLDLSPEPDLHPLYPTTTYIAALLSSHSGLTPAQKTELVSHCLTRACIFGELPVLQYLLSDSQAQAYINLGIRDEDGLGLISLAIYGFGADSERDVEREECVRLLISQGADLEGDNAGWTPLHHAALLSPPTLISYLMTHGCSPFALTHRNLTPLDVVTAHSILPGRDDVALLLEEAMRGEGWTGGRMEQKRRLFEQRMKRAGRQKEVREDICKNLGVSPTWWGPDPDPTSPESDLESDDGEDNDNERIYTPLLDYSSMLVFSPPLLPYIFDSLIIHFQPSLRNSIPANTLYMLARFACLTCDHTWLEDLIIGATDAIEETFFSRADDVTYLVFWLYNTTIWLHLLQCDTSINEACEMLGSFEIIEEVINSVFVFIIRFTERRIDQLLDVTLLDFSPLASEFESLQFESDWSFLRPFTGKRKPIPFGSNLSGLTQQSRTLVPSSPPTPIRPLSPSHSQGTLPPPTPRSFSSLRQSFARRGSHSTNTPLSLLFPDAPPPPSPVDLTSFLTSLHTMLTLSDINPALITQLWSQVMYWTSCEIFNRVITRKKYLCRSRAMQISMNLATVEEWLDMAQLPLGIHSHLMPVRDLLNWLQCLSSISEFSELVATIQPMKGINPLQMRRAVRDYKYEVNEGRMTDECIQYLTQLQKDWERHRVKLGLEALRKEMSDRDREEEDVLSLHANESSNNIPEETLSISTGTSDGTATQYNIDALFGTRQAISSWEPVKPPPALGELLDSRYMLPLLFPSDPRMLAALPDNIFLCRDEEGGQRCSTPSSQANGLNVQDSQGKTVWKFRNRKLREVEVSALRWVDGVRSAARWGRPIEPSEDGDGQGQEPVFYTSDDPNTTDITEPRDNVHVVPLTRKPSGRNKSRPSFAGEAMPVVHSYRPT